MTPRTITKAALGISAISGFVTSLWILLAPRSFYDDFPGLGNPWISPDGPYNEHLLRDYGAGMLGLSVLAVCAFVWLSRRLAIAAGLALLAASVPHLAYHLFHLDPYETGDQVGIIASLTVGPILALVIVFAAMRLSPEPAAIA
jgi:hypothetical protein